MPRTLSSSTMTIKSNVKPAMPFCKVCFDSGKSEEEYTSHYVKSEPGHNGKVVCPTLLGQQCTYCSELGHTVSHCRPLAMVKKDRDARRRKSEFKEKEKSTTTPGFRRTHLRNAYAAFLMEDDDDEIQTAIPLVEEYPSLCTTKTKSIPLHTNTTHSLSYARMLLKTDNTTILHVEHEVPKTKIKAPTKEPTKAPTKAPWATGRDVGWAELKKSWADWSDSDDDEDEDDDDDYLGHPLGSIDCC